MGSIGADIRQGKPSRYFSGVFLDFTSTAKVRVFEVNARLSYKQFYRVLPTIYVQGFPCRIDRVVTCVFPSPFPFFENYFDHTKNVNNYKIIFFHSSSSSSIFFYFLPLRVFTFCHPL